jgi:glycosyltransferase involved in cell wall biosynthesis
MNNLTKITIVTVVKNSAGTIEKAIRSVVRQGYPNLEYIILDGASTDGTLDIIKKYEKEISSWKSENDGGASDCYNKAIDLSSGEIIGYLNADDFYEDGVLLKVGKLFQQDNNLDVLSFRYRVVELQNNEYVAKEESAILDAELDKNKDCSCLGINAKFFRKDVFLRYGSPLANIKNGQSFLSNDTEFLIRLILNNVHNFVVDEVGYNYLLSEKSNSFSSGYKENLIYIEDKVLIAQRFLSDEFKHLLNSTWEKKFKKWVKKYRAKLVKQNIKLKNFSEAKRNLSLGAKENGVAKFLFHLLKTFIRS